MVDSLLAERWGGRLILLHGKLIDAAALPALVAGDREGLATFVHAGGAAELVTLDAVVPGRGIGTALVGALVALLRERSIARLCVTTTNDNLAALGFYQRRGFRLVRLRPGAVEVARHLKPSLPATGRDAVPIRDEIELELLL